MMITNYYSVTHFKTLKMKRFFCRNPWNCFFRICLSQAVWLLKSEIWGAVFVWARGCEKLEKDKMVKEKDIFFFIIGMFKTKMLRKYKRDIIYIHLHIRHIYIYTYKYISYIPFKKSNTFLVEELWGNQNSQNPCDHRTTRTTRTQQQLALEELRNPIFWVNGVSPKVSGT